MFEETYNPIYGTRYASTSQLHARAHSLFGRAMADARFRLGAFMAVSFFGRILPPDSRKLDTISSTTTSMEAGTHGRARSRPNSRTSPGARVGPLSSDAQILSKVVGGENIVIVDKEKHVASAVGFPSQTGRSQPKRFLANNSPSWMLGSIQPLRELLGAGVINEQKLPFGKRKGFVPKSENYSLEVIHARIMGAKADADLHETSSRL